MYFYGYFQTDVLINFFIPLRRAEAITWQNFVPVVQRNEFFYMQSQDAIYEEFITLPGSR